MKKILIIEDKEYFYNCLRNNLSFQYEILWGKTAKEGLEKLKIRPDIVILDMTFPKKLRGLPKKRMGLKVLKKIKEYDNTIKVIIVGSEEDIEERELKQKGSFTSIMKYELEKDSSKLLDAIKNALKES